METWGRCPCGGAYRDNQVTVSPTPGGVAIDVSRGVCETCGSPVYRADTLWRLEALRRGAAFVVTP